MNIKFEGKHKGLTSFTWNNVPKLSVLTGINGSGKTQILSLIRDHTQNGIAPDLLPYSQSRQDYKIEITDFLIEKRGVLSWSSNGAHINLEQQKFGYKDLEYLINILSNYISKENQEDDNLVEKEAEIEHNTGKNRFKSIVNNKKDKIIEFVEKTSGIAKLELTPADISYYLPEEILLEDYDLFNQDSLDFIFFMYIYKKEANERLNLNLELSEKAPWDILNEVISKANLPYQVTSPKPSLVTPIFKNALNSLSTNRFNIQLINPENGEEIGFNYLSSGERIIASLALLLYYTQNRNQRKKLLILDEPDAHLHPTLTKQFFDVIQDVIIDKYDGQVIMATHSPSTVALAPEESIFIVSKVGDRIKKSTKDNALSILTENLPSFSVYYENRRQVFVESPNDVLYYEKIYKKLKPELIPEISLTFISSGDSRTDKNGSKIANSSQVINITSLLLKAGNKLIWGIIDWDLKNPPSNQIVVNGENQRYSIENYLLDPILMTALLLREKIVTREELNIGENTNFGDFNQFTEVELQKVCDYFIGKISDKFDTNESIDKEQKLVNEKIIKIPNWFLQYPGHELEEKIISIFPGLNQIKKGKENGLKMAVIDYIIDDLPELISIDFLNTFKNIQS